MAKNPLPIETYLKRTSVRTQDVRGDYFRDQTAIIHSLPFRRLKHKTQVFFAPSNDHVCTRIEHVLHVASIAATICKGLNQAGWAVDPDLAYAIGLGHDLGHAPFGHAGETALNKILGGKNAFVHEVNSYRVVEHLAERGKGLNLTYAVKDGIITHNGEKFERFLDPVKVENDLENIHDRSCTPSSYEGCIVRFSDKIAYLGRDIEDAIIAKFIKRSDVPPVVRKELGDTNGHIINEIVLDVIDASIKYNKIQFSDDTFILVNELKKFNYEQIYQHPRIVEYEKYCTNIINRLFEYLFTLYARVGRDFPKYGDNYAPPLDASFGHYIKALDGFYQGKEDKAETIIMDYIAGMTDLYALECMRQISIPAPIAF